MTHNEQWKRIRAPIVKRAWVDRTWYRNAFIDDWSEWAIKAFHRDSSAKRLLKKVRAAQRAGENPLLWKLAKG